MTRIPGVARRLLLARLVLSWEVVWPRLWPILGVAGLFASLALFDVLPILPGWLHALILAGCAGALIWTLRQGARQFRLPTTSEAERRLEHDSRIDHRPLTTLIDMPSGDVSDPGSAALWQIHLARTLATVKNLRVHLPQPGLARRDPYALRFAVAILVVVGIAVAGDDADRRFVRAVTPDLQGLSATRLATLELWITPPDYTGLPPRLLASADETAVEAPDAGTAIKVPVGSRVLALVNQGKGTPQLRIGDASSDLEAAGEKAWRVDLPLDEAGNHMVAVVQSSKTLGSWPFVVAEDTAPEITFADPPEGSQRDALRLTYRVLDDYGVVAVRAEIFGPTGEGAIDSAPLAIDLPAPIGNPRDGEGASFHDLTAHPWAGLDVSIQLVATDGPGQDGRSDRLSVKLPERVFTHPVAQKIIAQRRALALAENQRLRIARELHNIAASPGQYGNDTTVFLSLMAARSRLVHNAQDGTIEAVQSLLWEIALRVEDGNLSLAERELRNAEQRLQEALARDADDAEISQLTEELREALDRFLDALAENLAEQLRDFDLSNLPELDGNIMDRESLQQMLDEMEQLARSGNRDAAQQLLSQLQKMLENLQNQPMAGQPQGSSQAQEMMRELQNIVRRQQELYDRTFQREQQNGDSRSEAEADSAAQNELRRQLGELMRTLGERTGQIPQNFGNAERAMRDAEGQLSQGQDQGALSAQGQALEELRQGAGGMMTLLLPGLGQGQGQGPGQQPGMRGRMVPVPGGQQGRDPLGRPRSSTGTDPTLDGDERNPGIGNGLGAERVLEIQKDLRNRLRDAGRSPAEIEYFLRLLRRF